MEREIICCGNCIWHSDGFGDEVRGSGYCYSSEEYVAHDGLCDYYQESLRDEPLVYPEIVPGADHEVR